MSLQPGTRIGAFEILSLIGSGGMGEVYRARDTKLNRDVAVKVLPSGVASDPDRLSRFRLEAQVLASLNHPNIAHIYGVEDSQDVQALIMELVDGPTLADRISLGPLPVPEATAIAAQIGRAIESAHAQGVIHRDLKPANVKIRPDGGVKVLDFGLAKAIGPGFTAKSIESSHLPTVASPAITQVGMVLGTVAYMSPEQARGRTSGRAADVWAFGCVLYEMLTGRAAFAGETVSDTIAKTIGQEPDWKALPAATPARIRELLRRCLQKDESKRLQNIADARTDLDVIVPARAGWRRTATVATAAAAVALAIVIGARWVTQRPASLASAPVPMTILIADFENRTNDPTFDHTLEPVLRISLENAAFISAYDRTRINGALGVRPPDQLDERAALELAVKQGVTAVLSGSIDKEGNGYVLSATATQTVSGARMATATSRAASKDQAIQATETIATTIRNALGDDTSDSTRLFARTTLSTTSLEVVRNYALAQDAASLGKFEDALRYGAKTVELDPKFGIGYQVLAVASQNLDRRKDALRYIDQALRHLDGMSERERLTTRGMFFRLNDDYAQCEKEYKALSERYAADVVGHNQRALCLVGLGRMAEAVTEMRRAVELLPRRTIFRINLALYLAYAGEFDLAEREARFAISQGGNPGWGPYALGVALQGQGRVSDATATYRSLEKVDDRWASSSRVGLAELAAYEGRYSDARTILSDGAGADASQGHADRAALKFATLGALEVLAGRSEAAKAAVVKALATNQSRSVRFIAAMTLVDVDDVSRARALSAALASESSPDSRADARIIDAHAVIKDVKPLEAVELLQQASQLADSWLVHFELGRAYLLDGRFAQADSEFDQCLKRRGETLASEPLLFAQLPAVHYYQGRAREGLKTERFADSYRRYIDIRGKSNEDPLLPDARRRGGL